MVKEQRTLENGKVARTWEDGLFDCDRYDVLPNLPTHYIPPTAASY